MCGNLRTHDPCSQYCGFSYDEWLAQDTSRMIRFQGKHHLPITRAGSILIKKITSMNPKEQAVTTTASQSVHNAISRIARFFGVIDDKYRFYRLKGRYWQKHQSV